ncbi:hypothetical protein ACP8Y2_19315 [Herpetosiphon llansteffanensis]
MKSFFRRQRPTSLRERGKGKVRWTIWELTALVVSIIMMATPLLAAISSAIFPFNAQAQTTPRPTSAATPVTPLPATATQTYPVPTETPLVTPCPTAEPTNTPTETATTYPTPGTPGTPTDTPSVTDTPTSTSVISPTDTPSVTDTPGLPTDTPELPTSTSVVTPTITTVVSPTATNVVSPTAIRGGMGGSARLHRPLGQTPDPCATPPTVVIPPTDTVPPEETPTGTITGSVTLTPDTPTVDPCLIATCTPVATIPTDIATTTETTLPASEPIAVAKSSSRALVQPGETFSYIITVSFQDNGDGQTSRSVTISDPLPSQVTFIGVQQLGTATCVGGPTVNCNGTVTAGNPIVVTIQVRVNASVALGTSIVNTVSASAANRTLQASDTVIVPSILPTTTIGTAGPSFTPIVITTTPNTPIIVTNTPDNSTPVTPIVNTPVTPIVNTPVTPIVNTPVTPIVNTPVTPIVNTSVPVTTRPNNTPRPNPSNTPRPNQPTNTPQPNQPSNTPRPDITSVPATNVPVATVVPPSNPTATPRPGVPVATATPRPGGGSNPTATPRPGAPVASATNAPAGSQPTNAPAPATATPTNPAGFVTDPIVTGLQFQKKSDWGSRFAGESLVYTITIISPTNSLNAGTMRDVVVVDQLPSNLETNGPIKVSDQNARVEQQGNQITVRVGVLPAGQTLTIMIPVKIKDGVAAQTRIVNQAQLNFTGLAQPIYSNISSVLVVGAAPAGSTTTVPNATAGTGGAATANPATVTPNTGVGSGQGNGDGGTTTDVGTINPATNMGIPATGFVLFALTMLVHVVRVRREMTRI